MTEGGGWEWRGAWVTEGVGWRVAAVTEGGAGSGGWPGD